jgi:hypothetical protein
MSEPEQPSEFTARTETQQARKKPYQKPDFRFERVFETRALSCGKIVTTQSQCALITKRS